MGDRAQDSKGTSRARPARPHAIRLSAWERRLRLGAVWVGLLLLVGGTFFGQDDHFPFGPFRMYSVANELDGEVSTLTFVAVTGRGLPREIRPDDFGLRPAEVEGQLERLLEDPSALGRLAATYAQLNGESRPITELRVVEETSVLENGRPVSSHSRVLVTWTSS